jgi:Bifunctional DNA primase/polymerase, N-terminal
MEIVRTSATRRKSQNTQADGKSLPAIWGRCDPGEEQTSPDAVYKASQQLVQAGLSIIPVEAYEGSKSPDSFRLPHPHDGSTGRPRPSWSIYKIRRPTVDELRRWYETDGPYGLAVIGGAVSGGQYGLGLEVIDFDTSELVGPWSEVVERKAPGLINRLVRVKTPRPGLHVYYRCSVFGVSQKLALAPATDDFGRAALDLSGHPVRKTLIEVKAEGGYCLIAPSPPRCHPSGRMYQYVTGSADLTAVPTITPEERLILLDAARSLSQWQEVRAQPQAGKKAKRSHDNSLPGDDFNCRAKWADILIPQGWAYAGEYGEETRWCRPGKDAGVSATTNHDGSDLLHVFSSSAPPFEADRWYSKFSAYAFLNHGGDFQEAARDLREQGYGKKMMKAGKR